MNNHLKHIAYIAIWTFTVVVVWIGISIYFQSVQPQIDPEILKEAEAISPVFDRAALEGVERRKQVDIDLASPIERVNFEENVVEVEGGELILLP